MTALFVALLISIAANVYFYFTRIKKDNDIEAAEKKVKQYKQLYADLKQKEKKLQHEIQEIIDTDINTPDDAFRLADQRSRR
jgi:hypothetical protein